MILQSISCSLISLLQLDKLKHVTGGCCFCVVTLLSLAMGSVYFEQVYSHLPTAQFNESILYSVKSPIIYSAPTLPPIPMTFNAAFFDFLYPFPFRPDFVAIPLAASHRKCACTFVVSALVRVPSVPTHRDGSCERKERSPKNMLLPLWLLHVSGGFPLIVQLSHYFPPTHVSTTLSH